MSTDKKAPLEGGPDAPAGSSLREAVERAVLSTSTSALRKDGIESLRILSESKLLAILRSSLQDEPRSRSPDQSRSCKQEELEKQYRQEWELLKAKHQESLCRMEQRMERLAQILQELRAAPARIEEKPHQGGELESSSDSERRRRELLRDMFSPRD